MMEDLITDLRNKTGMGRFARAEVREILGYLESVGWLSEPKAAEEPVSEPEPPAHEPPPISEPAETVAEPIHADGEHDGI